MPDDVAVCEKPAPLRCSHRQTLRGCRVAVRSGRITSSSFPQSSRSGTVERREGGTTPPKTVQPCNPYPKAASNPHFDGRSCPEEVAGLQAQPRAHLLLLHRRPSVTPSITVAVVTDQSNDTAPCNPHESRDVSIQKRWTIALLLHRRTQRWCNGEGDLPEAENAAFPTTSRSYSRKRGIEAYTSLRNRRPLHCCTRRQGEVPSLPLQNIGERGREAPSPP